MQPCVRGETRQRYHGFEPRLEDRRLAHGIFHQEMEADLRAVVERLTRRKVPALLSANHIEPDVAAAIFILDDTGI